MKTNISQSQHPTSLARTLSRMLTRSLTLTLALSAVASFADKTWSGAVSSDWSNPANWVEGTIPSNGESITLTANTPNDPTNLDIPELHINTLKFDAAQTAGITIDGEKFYIKKFAVTASYSLYITNTILNDVVLDQSRVGVETDVSSNNNGRNVLHLAGTVSDDGRGYGPGYASNTQNLLLSGNNTFRAPSQTRFGGFFFYEDANLGLPPEQPETQSVFNEWGNGTTIIKPNNKHFHHMFIHPNRNIFYYIKVDSSIDATFSSILEPKGTDFKIAGRDPNSAKQGTLPILHLSSKAPDIKQIQFALGNPLFVKLEDGFELGPNGTAMIDSYQFATIDFNGHCISNHLAFYNNGPDYHSPYINSDRAHEAIIVGDYGPKYQFNASLFGGPGNIRFEGNFHENNLHSSSYVANLWKRGSGCLTFAGSANYRGNTFLESGTVILDHTVNNSPKINTPNANFILGPCNLILQGGDSEPAIETVGDLRINENSPLGARSIEVVAGNADASFTFNDMAFNQNSKHPGQRPVDFRTRSTGSGTASIVATALQNHATFGGVCPLYTWGNGSSWMKVGEDGVLGPMDDSTFSRTPDRDVIFDAPAGETELTLATGYNYCLKAIRFNEPAGATITIPNNATASLSDFNNGSAILLTPNSGDVTIRGGTLKHVSYHYPVSFLLFNSNATMRVETRIAGQINLQVLAAGPGKLVLANDNNGFEGLVSASAGATIEFPSISPKGANSACGNGNKGNELYVGQDATLRYIGTEPEGHSTDKILRVCGDGALDASGVGPLHFTAPDFASSTYARPLSFELTLTGSGEGIIDGSLSLGYWGSLRKTGSGRWTLHSSDSLFYLPTSIDEGTLALDGALPSDVEIAPNGALETSGCTLRRSLNTSGTLRYAYGPDATPITIWGKATLGGTLELSGITNNTDPTVILSAENGIEGTFDSIPPTIQLIYNENSVIAKRHTPTLIFFR